MCTSDVFKHTNVKKKPYNCNRICTTKHNTSVVSTKKSNHMYMNINIENQPNI